MKRERIVVSDKLRKECLLQDFHFDFMFSYLSCLLLQADGNCQIEANLVEGHRYVAQADIPHDNSETEYCRQNCNLRKLPSGLDVLLRD